MEFRQDPGIEEFRASVRAFITQNLPADIARRALADGDTDPADVRRWTRILDGKGWSTPRWPVEHGGTGWSPLQQFVFEQELRRARAPLLDRVGIELVGPLLWSFGSEEQKATHLPAIRSCAVWWCQGFSEPGAGSDLAGLRTTAERQGDHYVVNGQKIWTTYAQHSDRMIALVRTDTRAQKHRGLSFLLLDMRSEGVRVRPIRTIDGGASLNEVFFDHVKVPVGDLVGEESKGWDYAKFLLTFERTLTSEVPHTKRDLLQVREISTHSMKNGRPLLEDPLFRRRLAELEIDVMALEWAVLRVAHATEDGPALRSVAAILKLRGSELFQRVAELAAEALGPHGIAIEAIGDGEPLFDGEALGVTPRMLFRRAASIYAGANEIQRGIIAKNVLGLG